MSHRSRCLVVDYDHFQLVEALGFSFHNSPTLESVITIGVLRWCGGGGGVVGGVDVVCGDGVDRRVGGVDCGVVCGFVCGVVCGVVCGGHGIDIRDDCKDTQERKMVWDVIVDGGGGGGEDIKFGDGCHSIPELEEFPLEIQLLVVKRCLKTQDMLRSWDLNGNIPVVLCPLCESQPDSHEHLFFECVFLRQVWDSLKVLAGIPHATASISDIVDLLIPISKRRFTRFVIAKLVVAASTYFIWQERNWLLFKKQKRMTKQVIDCIKLAVQLKLILCCFRKFKYGLAFIHLWKLPESFISSS
ncbi:reverse transcriptase domain, reverse transcriptase zinc-binding domain protein [Tanacetum coccineum]